MYEFSVADRCQVHVTSPRITHIDCYRVIQELLAEDREYTALLNDAKRLPCSVGLCNHADSSRTVRSARINYPAGRPSLASDQFILDVCLDITFLLSLFDKTTDTWQKNSRCSSIKGTFYALHF